MSKRFLQAILIIVGLILTLASIWGIIGGITDSYYELITSNTIQGNIILDSNLRFYYGLTLGLGLVIFWIIPFIEKHTTVFRLISLMIFLGGTCRIISMITFGIPTPPFILFSFL